MGGDGAVFRFVRGELDQEELAAVVTALLHRLAPGAEEGNAPPPPRPATRADDPSWARGASSRPPAWDEPRTFQAPNSWSPG
ncbi:acyl-CoA carboxylase epsilon subunit [Nonomuraea sp. B5E05]|uniref:acyl-CoA carboxylase epsilon subunit n=1 Tax=Nonomuraea sp. B5E05 TaxID=3153569 RepID=UPI0032617D8E